MSDPKPDRILAEESDNPWVKLILWAHEHPLDIGRNLPLEWVYEVFG